MKSHADTVSEDQELIHKLRALQRALCGMMEQQIKDLKIRLDGQTSTNLELATQLQAEKEASQALQAETDKLEEKLKEQEDKALVALQAVELLVEEEISEETIPRKKKKSSGWKRICHFLGLRRKRKDSPHPPSETPKPKQLIHPPHT